MDFDFNDDEMNDWLDNKSDATPTNYEYRYCLECGRIVAVMDWDTELVHTVMVMPGNWNGYGTPEPDIDLCYGPFATSTPPENFGEDWDIDLVEPDGDEMFIINHNAEQLLADFE